MKLPLSKGLIGLYLVLLLFAFNFVFNQPMAMQDALMAKHQISVTKFNMLYVLQTLPVIFLLIPLGILYDNVGAVMIIPAAILQLLGQVLLAIFAPLTSKASFPMMLFGRAIQGIGVEVLYVGQAALCEVWMGNFVGLVVLLSELGEILNVLLTPLMVSKSGLLLPLLVGVGTCVLSAAAAIVLYFTDRKYNKRLNRSGSTPISNTEPV